MTKIDPKIEDFGRLKLRNYRYVEKLSVFENVSANGHYATIDLLLRSDDMRNTQRLFLSLRDAGDFRFGLFSGMMQLSDLQIVNISDRQWHNHHYEIFDAEDDRLFARCRDFVFGIRTPVDDSDDGSPRN
jgi:hypothetical protein